MVKELARYAERFEWVKGEPGRFNYYMPWWWIQRNPPLRGTVNVALYTHCLPKLQDTRGPILSLFDWVICLDEADVGEIKALLGHNRVDYVHCGVDNRFVPRPIRIGLCGRLYQDGRKQEWMLRALADHMDMGLIEFVMWGQGWEHLLPELEGVGISAVAFTPEYTEYPKIMRNIDYLLVTDIVTGGPTSVPEALACGKPIITTRTGYARDLAGEDIEFFDDVEGLARILKGKVEIIERRRNLVRDFTWENWTRKHEEIFAKVEEGRCQGVKL